MSSVLRSRRPRIDHELVERWPRPPEIRMPRWRRMSIEQRERWLIEHTYEHTDAGWVRREDRRDSPTASMVDEVVVTSEGANALLLAPMIEDLQQAYPIEYDVRGGVEGRPNGFWVAMVLLLLVVAVVIWAMLTAIVEREDTSSPEGPPVAESPLPADQPDAEEATSPDPSSPVDESATSSGESVDVTADPDTPVALTDGPWRFFFTSAEDQPLYDFAFAEDGTFIESGAAHNYGTYAVNGSEVVLNLTRVQTLTASNGSAERSEEVTWVETFAMTRDGNSMTGTWIRDDWVFSYDDGFVVRGPAEPSTGIFARPQTPDDAG